MWGEEFFNLKRGWGVFGFLKGIFKGKYSKIKIERNTKGSCIRNNRGAQRNRCFVGKSPCNI